MGTKDKALVSDASAAVQPTNGAGPVLDITVNLEGLLIGDLLLMERAQTGDLTPTEMVELLDRVVVGGARRVPITRIGDILQALTEHTNQLANPTQKDEKGAEKNCENC